MTLGIMFSLGMFSFNTASTSGNNSGSWGALMGVEPPSLVGSEAMKSRGLSTQNMFTCHADINEALAFLAKFFNPK